MTAQNQATKVITGKVRLSYAHLFEPFTNIEERRRSTAACS